MARVLEQATHTGVKPLAMQEHHQTRGHQVAVDIRKHTDPAVIVRIDCEVSTDSGQTWEYGGGFTIQGGSYTDKQEQPVRWSVAAFGHEPHPSQPPCPHRLVRGILAIEGGSVETEVHIHPLVGISVDESVLP